MTALLNWYLVLAHLMEGSTLSLSSHERLAMYKYLKEALDSGHICPSTSSAKAGFSSLNRRMVASNIDYWGLNSITIKNKYPLPLMTTAFVILQGATIFIKLDLHNAYHIFRICEVDKWKLAFNTPTGHYKSQVM